LKFELSKFKLPSIDNPSKDKYYYFDLYRTRNELEVKPDVNGVPDMSYDFRGSKLETLPCDEDKPFNQNYYPVCMFTIILTRDPRSACI